MILQSFRWNILCCHVKIPQSHKNMYRLISTSIRYFRILCTNYTHSNRVEMLLLQKSFTTAAYWQRTHSLALLHREAARLGAGELKVGGQTRDEISWPSSCPDRGHSPGQPGQLLQPPSASCTRHTTPPYSVWLYWLLPLLSLKVLILTCKVWSHPSHKIPQHNAH